MKLGMNVAFQKRNPEKWADKIVSLGCSSAVLPADYRAGFHVIDGFKKAAEERGIVIAEVGAWSNPMSPNTRTREKAIETCIQQLKLADYVGARCCVNVSGANGPVWDRYYPGNFDPDFYKKLVETIQMIIEKAAPQNTAFAIEPMPNMIPTGPDEYLKLIQDVGSDKLKVHMDITNWMNSMERFHNQRAFMDDVFWKLNGRIASAHLKDCTITGKLPVSIVETPVGKGMFDVDYYMRKLEEQDTDLPVLIEHLKNPREYFRSMKTVVKRFSNYAVKVPELTDQMNFDPNTGEKLN